MAAQLEAQLNRAKGSALTFSFTKYDRKYELEYHVL
jgi:hypothetical protein